VDDTGAATSDTERATADTEPPTSDSEPATSDTERAKSQPGAANEPGAASGSTETRRVRRLAFEIVETLVLTVAIFLGVQTFVVQPFEVEGSSMEQTLLPNQFVLIDKLTPRWSPYEPGDIVVLTPPRLAAGRGTTPFIKRVIAVAGDRVELRDGAVYVNGTRLDEPYLFEEDGARQETDPLSSTTSWIVPPGDLFVLGDHRAVSQDSRAFGPITVSSVLGRAFLRYWPLDSFEVIGR
jgi:signal peptidase I